MNLTFQGYLTEEDWRGQVGLLSEMYLKEHGIREAKYGNPFNDTQEICVRATVDSSD